MKDKQLVNLSRRERQIMDVIFASGQATALEIQQALPDPPSYSTVRTQLRVLEEKGFLTHAEMGPRYLFSPTISREKAKTSALRHLMRTFFDNSAERVVTALLDVSGTDLTDDDFDRLSHIIEKARQGGK
jgi:predicted transcriptional regulator